MATKIRLARGGAKKRPFYRIVVADERAPRDGKYIERLGTYNPMLAKDDENRVLLESDRITHWIKNGAKPTDRVQHLLFKAGVVENGPAQKPARRNKKAGDEPEAEAPAKEATVEKPAEETPPPAEEPAA